MNALVDLARAKLGIEGDINVITINSKPRTGSYKSKIKDEGMTFVLTKDPALKNQMIADGWSHRGFAEGDVLYKEV